MLGTKEFYELIAIFEKTYKGSFRLDKEEKDNWKRGRVYQHGEANATFQAFMKGYALGKLVERQN